MSNHDREGPQSPGPDTAPDGSLARAWQQASDEQPPPELDAAIIAAARKSVQDRVARLKTLHTSPRSWNRLMQWQPLAAAAAVAGLAFTLVQLLPRDRDIAPSIRMEESAPGPATAEDKQSAIAPAATLPQAAEEEKRGTGASTPSVTEATAEAPSQATAKASDTAATADGTGELHATEADQREALAPEMTSPAAPAAAAAPARERSSGNVAPTSAADWAASIAALYASGDTTGAADALRAFRAAGPHADTYLPDSLREWARTIK